MRHPRLRLTWGSRPMLWGRGESGSIDRSIHPENQGGARKARPCHHTRGHIPHQMGGKFSVGRRLVKMVAAGAVRGSVAQRHIRVLPMQACMGRLWVTTRRSAWEKVRFAWEPGACGPSVLDLATEYSADVSPLSTLLMTLVSVYALLPSQQMGGRFRGERTWGAHSYVLAQGKSSLAGMIVCTWVGSTVAAAATTRDKSRHTCARLNGRGGWRRRHLVEQHRLRH